MNLLSRFLACAALAVSAAAGANAAEVQFLEPGEAFRTAIVATPGGDAVMQIRIAPGYHLYRDRFALRDADNASVVAALPEGRTVFDAALGQQVAI